MKKQFFGKKFAVVMMAACLMVTFALPSFAATSENYIYNQSATMISNSVAGNVSTLSYNENTIYNGLGGKCSYAGNMIINDTGLLMENSAALGNVTTISENVNYIKNVGTNAFNLAENTKFTGISGSALLGDFMDYSATRNTIINR